MDIQNIYEVFKYDLYELNANEASSSDVKEFLEENGVEGLSRYQCYRLLKKASKDTNLTVETKEPEVFFDEEGTINDFVRDSKLEFDDYQIISASVWGSDDKKFYSAKVKPAPSEKRILETIKLIEENITRRKPVEKVDDRHFLGEDFCPGEDFTPSSRYLEIAMPDLHINKCGIYTPHLTIDEQIDNLSEAYYSVFETADYIMGNAPVDLGLLMFNDMINSEADGRTTAGTPQDNITTPDRGFAAGASFILNIIDQMLTEASVNNIYIPVVFGNHSRQEEIRIATLLELYYAKEPRVNIINDPNDRKYHRHGDTLICYSHSDKNKPERLALNMSQDRPKDFAECKYKRIHLGHEHRGNKYILHYENENVLVRYYPSPSKAVDTWHNQKGWDGLPRSIATLFDSRGETVIEIENK